MNISLKQFFNTNTRLMKKYTKSVQEINALEASISELTDDQLQNKTAEFREKLQNGATLDSITHEAFAVVREASKRVLKMRHFDVQLLGGLVLADGNISEMPTGEGKTLVASLPSYLHALSGKGVHVITVNDYLAKRDFDQIGQIHRFLGLSVGLNLPMMTPLTKQKAYEADITYGVGTEFGFDYLRDNMVPDATIKVQRPYHFAIIDEVDSVLIDEAKTPLIVAGKAMGRPDLYKIAALLAKRFVKDVDYDFDPETKATSLTDQGIEKVEKAFSVDNLYDLAHQSLYHYVIQAVRAHVMFEKDVDYIVKDDKIHLVDMFTGRIMEGRTMSDGLHQALEAKEGVSPTEENKAQAQITIQNYFRMYPTMAGMTGTAKTQEEEFRQVYGMEVIQIPTNRPKIRVDQQDVVYETKHQKYTAVVKEVKKRHQKGQPVLVGTTSILQSDEVAKYLRAEGLEFQLLNAKSVEQEVKLISEAGQLGQITVATNMAGRGTDIELGDGVADVGGLYVLGTEKHESRRIDNQLRGRSGRQGDPGESQFILSLEDDMYTRFARDAVEKFLKSMKTDADGMVLNKTVHEITERTQRIVEGSHYSMREYNLKLDDVINEQRNVVYSLRDKILEKQNLLGILKQMTDETVHFEIEEACPDDLPEDQWQLKRLESRLNELMLSPVSIPSDTTKKKVIYTQASDAKEELHAFIDSFEENADVMQILPKVMLHFIDQIWVQHLESMTRLKEGIGLRHYQQEDPMRIYQREGLELFQMHFNQMRTSIAKEIVAFMKKIQTPQQEVQHGIV